MIQYSANVLRRGNIMRIIMKIISLLLIILFLFIPSSFAIEKVILTPKKAGVENKTNTTIKHIHQLQIVKHCKPAENPYINFNFLVEIDGDIRAGFQECSGLEPYMDVADYRGTNYFDGKKLNPGDFQKEQDYNHPIITLKNGISDTKFNITDGMNIKLIIVDKPKQPNKLVDMKYLDNLVSWGDVSFSQDTIEVTDCSSNSE